MIPAKTARMLTRYNTWSNKVWFDAIAALPDGEAMKPRKSLFKNMVHTMNHILVIDLIWQAHLEGRDHGMSARNSAESPALEDWWKAQQAIDKWYEQWSDKQTDETMADRRQRGQHVAGGNAAASVSPHRVSPRLCRRHDVRGAGLPSAGDGLAGVLA